MENKDSRCRGWSLALGQSIWLVHTDTRVQFPALTTQPKGKKGKRKKPQGTVLSSYLISPIPFFFFFLLSQSNLGSSFLGSGTRLVKHKADVRNTRATQSAHNGRRQEYADGKSCVQTKALISNCSIGPKEEYILPPPHQGDQNYINGDSRERGSPI